MNPKKILAWIILGLCFVLQSKAAEKHGGNLVPKDSAVDISLTPFGLKAHDLPIAKLILASHSPKSGAGKERLEVFGTGEVKLIRSANSEAPEEVLSAKVRPSEVAKLLSRIEAERFLQLENEYKGNSVYSLRTQVSLSLPRGEKTVFVDNTITFPEFERMVAAIEALAGLANPHALNRQYFHRLFAFGYTNKVDSNLSVSSKMVSDNMLEAKLGNLEIILFKVADAIRQPTGEYGGMSELKEAKGGEKALIYIVTPGDLGKLNMSHYQKGKWKSLPPGKRIFRMPTSPFYSFAVVDLGEPGAIGLHTDHGMKKLDLIAADMRTLSMHWTDQTGTISWQGIPTRFNGHMPN